MSEGKPLSSARYSDLGLSLCHNVENAAPGGAPWPLLVINLNTPMTPAPALLT